MFVYYYLFKDLILSFFCFLADIRMAKVNYLKVIMLCVVVCAWFIIGSMVTRHTNIYIGNIFLTAQNDYYPLTLSYDDPKNSTNATATHVTIDNDNANDLTAEHNIKIITFTDIKHIKILMNWLLHLDRLSILKSNIVVMAFDTMTHNELKAHLNPLYELVNLGIRDSISTRNVWYYRVKFMLEYMRNNTHHIWISDNDNNFLYNPFKINEFVEYFDNTDIMASRGVWPDNWACQFGHKKNWIDYEGIKEKDMWKMNHITLTFGNLIIKNNKNTQILLAKVLKDMRSKYGNDDMRALNCILKREYNITFKEDLILKNENNQFDQSIFNKDTTLRVTLMPYYRFIINSGVYCKWNTTYCHSIINNNIKNNDDFPVTWHEFKNDFYKLNKQKMPYFPSLWMLNGYQNMCDSRLKNITINC